MAKCFQCGGEHTGTYSCLPPEAPALTKTLLERLKDEVAHPDTSGAPYVNDSDLLGECLAEIERLTGERDFHQRTSVRLGDVNVQRAQEIERLRAALAIVTKDRDTLLEMSGHTIEQVARRIEKLRRGAPEPKADYRNWPREVPHCPSCDCGSEPPATPTL